MSGHWKDGNSELDIGGVGGGFGGGGAGRRSRSGMMLGLQVMTARAKELVIMSAAVGVHGIINGPEALAPGRAERSLCGEGGAMLIISADRVRIMIMIASASWLVHAPSPHLHLVFICAECSSLVGRALKLASEV